MRRKVPIMLALLLAGCMGPETQSPQSTPPVDAAPAAWNATYFLKASHKLDMAPPAKPSPDRVTADPFPNAFANEDLHPFRSTSLPAATNVSFARLVVYFEVVAPAPDPFPNQGDPSQARTLVFWLGTNATYPVYVSTYSPAVLLPGTVYKAETDLPLPKPGWILPAGESLDLLIVPLVVSGPGAELRFLVDAAATPSRIELRGNTTGVAVPPEVSESTRGFTIAGNAGAFTGATRETLPTRIRAPVTVARADTYLEVWVIFRGNAGGKSDLDFTLLAPDGSVAMASTTPYQSERVRLFLPHLSVHGPGDYVAQVDAYSGVDTRFDLVQRTSAHTR